MLLKNIPGLLPTLNDSAIVKSKLWDKDVEHIHPSQLTALRTKTLLDNPNSNIDQEIIFLIKHLQFAELEDLCVSPLNDYYLSSNKTITTIDFVAGLRKLPQEYRLATIFGLEMELSAIRVSMLTVKQAYDIQGQTELAQDVLRSTLLSTKTIYMFWRAENDGEHVALDDLNEMIYGAYGCSWSDLGTRYKYMVANHHNPLIMSA